MNPRAWQDVVKLIEHRHAPPPADVLHRVGEADGRACDERYRLDLGQDVLAHPVGVLDVALRGVAALENIVELAVVDRHVVSFALDCREERIRRGRENVWIDRPGVQLP